MNVDRECPWCKQPIVGGGLHAMDLAKNLDGSYHFEVCTAFDESDREAIRRGMGFWESTQYQVAGEP